MINSRCPWQKKKEKKKATRVEKNVIRTCPRLRGKAVDAVENQKRCWAARPRRSALILSQSSEMRRQSIAGRLHGDLLSLKPRRVTVRPHNAHMFTQQTHTSVGIQGPYRGSPIKSPMKFPNAPLPRLNRK